MAGLGAAGSGATRSSSALETLGARRGARQITRPKASRAQDQTAQLLQVGLWIVLTEDPECALG